MSEPIGLYAGITLNFQCNHFNRFKSVKNWQADHHQTNYDIEIKSNFLSALAEGLNMFCEVTSFRK